jgi:MinD superfamily P-loop ATPase
MIISFASGKGGTGKTILSTSFALLLRDDNPKAQVNFLDCDVEEPNAALFLKPHLNKPISVGIPVPKIDEERCTYCGRCAEVCAYNALAVVKDKVLVFTELCHGCGGCTVLCPEQAVSECDREIGIVQEGMCGRMKFIHGKLNVGEPMAPPVIKAVKEHCLVKGSGGEVFTIIDAPPGTSCPVIEAVKNSDFSVLVTEPTPFGLHDLILAVETLRTLNIPFGIVVNRARTNDSIIDEYCVREHIPLLARIPMDRDIAVAYSNGIPFVHINERYQSMVKTLCRTVQQEAMKDVG